MTTFIEKGQFLTVEFFTDVEQEERYRDGDSDFYFIYDLNDETIEEAIINTLGDVSEKVYINVAPRRYAEVLIEDGEIEEVVDYGDSTLGQEDYIYVDSVLLTSSDYQLVYG